MMASPLAWDESSINAQWIKRKRTFELVFNFNVTHESKILEK